MKEVGKRLPMVVLSSLDDDEVRVQGAWGLRQEGLKGVDFMPFDIDLHEIHVSDAIFGQAVFEPYTLDRKAAVFFFACGQDPALAKIFERRSKGHRAVCSGHGFANKFDGRKAGFVRWITGDIKGKALHDGRVGLEGKDPAARSSGLGSNQSVEARVCADIEEDTASGKIGFNESKLLPVESMGVE